MGTKSTQGVMEYGTREFLEEMNLDVEFEIWVGIMQNSEIMGRNLRRFPSQKNIQCVQNVDIKGY